MARVVHFEIPADDPGRALEFYETVFGWTAHKWEGPVEYWLISTGQAGDMGIDGGLMTRSRPDQGVVNTIGVESVDDSVKAIVKAGGEIIMPKTAIPGVGYLAYFRDPEGNTFGVMHPDPTAT
jgi:uncharacterized protein